MSGYSHGRNSESVHGIYEFTHLTRGCRNLRSCDISPNTGLRVGIEFGAGNQSKI